VGLADWKVCNQKTWRRDVFQNVREGLIAQGLTKDESEGMVKTWWNSYFEHDGLRVFWVVPEGELEKVLPIEITPAPEKMVRVIVGRGEVMRPSLEKNLQKQLADGKLRNLSSHRFFEPYVARLRDFVSTPYFAKPTHEFLKYNSVTLSEMLENGKPVRGKTRNLRFIEKDGKLLTQSDKEEWQTISESEVKIGDRHYKFDKENNSYKSEPIDGIYYEIKMPQLLSEA